MSRKVSRGLTLTDMAAMLCIFVMLLAAFLPAADAVREQNTRLACMKNLRQIGMAMQMYANGERNAGFPRTYWAPPGEAVAPTAYSGVTAKDPFGKDAVAPNDVTTPFYLLVRNMMVDPAIFNCPATQAKPLHFANSQIGPVGAKADAATPQDMSNFPSEAYLSYSVNNPYPSREALDTRWQWDGGMPAEVAIAADMNPGGKAVTDITPTSSKADLHKANSRNHGGEGQNVLFGDGHVTWSATPFCGQAREDKIPDNIFSRYGGAGKSKVELKGDPIMGPASDSSDSVMVPYAGYKPAGKK